jgi:hypothetical protein
MNQRFVDPLYRSALSIRFVDHFVADPSRDVVISGPQRAVRQARAH